MATEKTVDGYIGGFDGWRGEALGRLRTLVDEEAPDATSSIKWAQPVWETNGPMIYMRAFSAKVNLGFWRGAEMDDPNGLLEGDGDRMKHLPIREGDAIREDAARDFVRQAVALNRAKGDPTRRK